MAALAGINPELYEAARIDGRLAPAEDPPYRPDRHPADDHHFSFGAAVGLFNSVINFTPIIVINAIARRVSEHSLWKPNHGSLQAAYAGSSRFAMLRARPAVPACRPRLQLHPRAHRDGT